mmetsp:Transcript_14629/g.21771  ORF Transcript_14629/g.21771 Transcript_14629/m.21771 type:complete len:128 (-) Transcript_14629:42-425(-)
MSLAGMEASVHTVMQMPGSSEHILIGTRSMTIYLISCQGSVVKSYALDSGLDKSVWSDMSCACASPRGKWVYGGSEGGNVFCFSTEEECLKHTINTGTGEVMGISHHPHRNIVATFGKDGILKLWRP